MGIKELIFSKENCPIGNSEVGCIGPNVQEYLLGLPLNDYPSLILVALITSFLATLSYYVILKARARKKKINLHKVIIFALASFIFALVIFYLLSLYIVFRIVY